MKIDNVLPIIFIPLDNSEFTELKMYDERIENLIELALVDGKLTDKEREVLLRKAIEHGIDRDEFEMVLDARLFEKTNANQTQTNASNDNSTPPPIPVESSNKSLNQSKCPSCGGNLPAYSTLCQDCGYEINQRATNATIQKLFEMLNDIESQREQKQDSSNPISAMGSFYAEAFSSMLGPGVLERKKMEVISTFPIPTTKADILEFLALAYPKAKKKGNFFTRNNPEYKIHNEMVPVWKTKCEQIIVKARFALKEDPTTLEELNYYAKQLEIE
jgi:hypothetical protein